MKKLQKKEQNLDKLEEIFFNQTKFMEELKDNDRLPEWPVDLTTKPGQRLIKEMIFNTIEELAEASFTLKNKMHKLTDDRSLDIDHYKEELGDALAYFVEICVLSGIDAKELYEEHKRKNAVVFERLRRNY